MTHFLKSLQVQIFVYHNLKFLLLLFGTQLNGRRSTRVNRLHGLQMIFQKYPVFYFSFFLEMVSNSLNLYPLSQHDITVNFFSSEL